MLRVDLVGEIDQAVSTDSFTVETAVRDAHRRGRGARPRPHHPGAERGGHRR